MPSYVPWYSIVAVVGAAATVGCNHKDVEDTGLGDVDAVASLSGPISCPDPSLRSASRYDRRQTPAALPMTGAYLSGGGLLVEDLDGDGALDLFLPSDAVSEMWWGRGDGYYDELGAVAFAGLDLTMAVGASAVDFDADGDLDVFVTRWERTNVLLRNNGDRTFTDVSAQAGIPTHAYRHQTASWGDIDADGDLDLFVGAYGAWTVVDVNEPVANCADHLPNPSQLWRNEGGWFTEISDRLPPEVHQGYVFASGFYDVDDDGYPELFVSNDDGGCAQSLLVDNFGGATFVPDASSAFHPQSHDMGMAVGDLNGDELPDFALSSWTTVSVLRSSANEGLQNGAAWIDAASATNIVVGKDQVYGWGTEFGDLDNDADLDLAMSFGYWSTYDGAGDPMDQPDALWVQGEDGVFLDEGASWGVADAGISRGVVLADLNGDGWLDITKRELDGPTPMYLSRCGADHWVRIKLRQGGWNTFAVGAKVRVTAGGKSQVRWLTSGSSGLYSGQPLELHFGLGAAETIDRIDVYWPDGRHSATDGVGANQVVTLTRD